MFTKSFRPLYTKIVICFLLASTLTLGVKFHIAESQLATIRTILNDAWDKANHRLMASAWVGGATANTTFETETTIYNDVWDQSNHFLRTSGGGGGGGDFSSNTSTSLNNEAVLFSGTGGKTGKQSKVIITPVATSATITPTDGKTFTFLNTLSLSGTDSSTVDMRTGGTVAMLGLTNTFTGRQDSTGAASTAPFKSGTTPPGSCALGDLFFDTDATAGQNIQGCTASNVWTPQGGAGGGGSGTVGTGATNNTARYTGAGTTVGPSTAIQLSASGIISVYNITTTITSDTTLGAHNMVKCNAGGGTVTATLPSAASTTASRYILVKGDATGTCNLAKVGSDSFNGIAGPISLTRQYDAIIVDLVDNSASGLWWLTTAKAQYGYHQLSVKGADLPTSNAAIIDPSEPRPKLVFDGTTSWCASWTFLLNPDYGTSPQIVWSYSMASATTGSAMIDWKVWRTASDAAEDAEVASYDTVNTDTDSTVPGTAGRQRTRTLSLSTVDSMVAGNLVTVQACRNMTDTATGNLEMLGAQLQYFKQ